ncbi:MAG: glycosyltransferase family 2 protein [Bacteroidetes bacterium]|nr:glycosyltransferase family 2 protein [Bacteroidota bacterium]MBU1114420.1 glycosyltransferase family 2 protein [Bacteroidota bacterium]MBU1798823.1 glycosyltransferase family 2 protein [Bacteroidota bacterium]
MNYSINQNNICVVIPIFNEIEFLDELLQRVSLFSSNIICVDDGSTDGSKELLEPNDKVTLISNGKNRGKGYALKVGLLKSLEFNCDFVVAIDADLQHLPEQIPEFVAALKDYDLVIGNRLHSLKGMPLQRIISNKITSWLLSKKVGIKILDSQSGFRAFRKEIIKSILPFETGFEAETEMLINATLNKNSIGYVKIPIIYNNNKSKMHAFQAIFGFLRVLLKSTKNNSEL